MSDLDDYGLVCKRTEASVLVSPRDCPCDVCHEWLVMLRGELAALREVERLTRWHGEPVLLSDPDCEEKAISQHREWRRQMDAALASLDALRGKV